MIKTRKIHLVPSFHYDVAYLRTCAEYLPECFRILDTALDILQKDEHYRFTVEQTFLLEQYCARLPDRLPLLKRFAAQSRLSVAPGMYVMPDMNMPDAESMIMQIQFGRAFLRDTLGIEPRACWIADCWGHHAQLPQILRKCGYESYFFWRCMRPDVLKNDFLWKGLDGTTIQTHWLARGYANLRFPTDAAAVNAAELSFAGCRPADIEDLSNQLQTYGPSPMLLVCNGGDFAVPQAAAPNVVDALNESGKLPPIRFSTPALFAAELEELGQLPTITGEFNAALQGTFTTNIRIKQDNRQLVARLLSLESLLASLHQPADLDPVWKLLLKQQFHDIICGTITDGALADCLNEHHAAAQQIDSVLAQLPAPAGHFNPLPWPRREIIELAGKPATLDIPAFTTIAESSARPLAETPRPQLPLTWENQYFLLSINSRGFITALTDRASGQQLINTVHRSPFGALSMQMDYGDSWLNFEGPLDGGSFASSLTQNADDPFDRRRPDSLANATTFLPHIQKAEVLFSSDDVLILQQTGRISFWAAGADFKTTITLRRWSPRIDYRTTLTPTGKNTRIRVAFPTAIPDARRFDEIPMGIQPDRRGEHVVQNFLAWCGPKSGLALLNRGIPAANVHDGVLMQTLFRSVAMEYKTASQASYNTGIAHTFEYSIMPSASLSPVIREALQLNRPILRAPLTTALPPITIDSGQAIISRLQLRPDGSLLARIYEPLGSPTIAIFRVAADWKLISETDPFADKKHRDIPRVGERVVIPMKPFEFKTILLRK